jgi:hypothetical protein
MEAVTRRSGTAVRGGLAATATDCIARLTFRHRGVRPPMRARFHVPHASSDSDLVLKAEDERRRPREGVFAGRASPLSFPAGRFRTATGRRSPRPVSTFGSSQNVSVVERSVH